MGTAMLLVYLFPPRDEQREPEMLLVPAVMFALAAAILAFALRNRGRRIAVCPGGLLVTQRGMIDVWPWREIVSVREREAPDRVYFFRIGMYRAATIERSDGRNLFVDRNRIAKVGELLDIIRRNVWECQRGNCFDDPDLTRIVTVWPSLNPEVRTRLLKVIDSA